MATVEAAGSEVDILHPLAVLDWTKCCPLPVDLSESDCQCVFLDGRLCVGGCASCPNARLYVTTPDLSSWITVKTPVHGYTPATYRSKLVLIGGVETPTGQVTNKLYSADTIRSVTAENVVKNTVNLDWQLCLPPMPTGRFGAGVVNTGSPEYLVVAGGAGSDSQPLDVVEVLVEEQWITVRPFPVRCLEMKGTCHSRRVYFLVNKLYANYEEVDVGFSYDVRSLLRGESAPWTKFRVPLSCACVVSFGQQFVAFGHRALYAYSEFVRGYIYAASFPPELFSAGHSVVLPTGELVVLPGGYRDRREQECVVKASLKMTQYGLNREFYHSVLAKLEGLGVKAVTSLAGPGNEEQVTRRQLNSAVKQLTKAGYGHPSTWNSLFKALETLDKKDLALEIENFFGGGSLEHLCLMVLVSCLKKHRCLTADQVCDLLPDYVPTVIKQHIAHKYRIHTGLLQL